MDMTDLQRRWWFANHPEFSWSRTRSGLLRRRFGDAVSNTALANERLRKENFIRKMMDANHTRERAEKTWKLIQDDASRAKNVAWAVNMASLIGAARELAAKTALSVAARRGAGRPPIGTPERAKIAAGRQAASLEEGGGPGKWVEVPRARHGLEHQSKMSGQPIRQEAGKLFIKEYEVNGVKFDDYKNGILYDYKAPRYTKFINEKGEFRDWFRGAKEARDRALAQAEAADGIPVVWKVGRDQVVAFSKAIGKVRGLTIEP